MGLEIEAGYVFGLEGIDGVAWEIGGSITGKGFSTVGGGLGVLGAEAQIVIGFHKGNFEEFAGIEWSAAVSLKIEIGGTVGVEFSGMTPEGIYVGLGGGAEIKGGVDVTYRYLHR